MKYPVEIPRGALIEYLTDEEFAESRTKGHWVYAIFERGDHGLHGLLVIDMDHLGCGTGFMICRGRMEALKAKAKDLLH